MVRLAPEVFEGRSWVLEGERGTVEEKLPPLGVIEGWLISQLRRWKSIEMILSNHMDWMFSRYVYIFM